MAATNEAILKAIAQVAPKAPVGSGNHAKVLLMGPPKQGKTISILSSAPAPIFVINCDPESSLQPAIQMGYGDRFIPVDVVSAKTWRQAREAARLAVQAGARTVVVDSLTFLCKSLIEELLTENSSNTQKAYGDLSRLLGGGCQVICNLPAHVFMVAHLTRSNDEKGLMPLISGQSKELIPAMVNDVVRFHYQADRKPFERVFMLGAHEDWSYLCRNVHKSVTIEATIPALFKELGIKENEEQA